MTLEEAIEQCERLAIQQGNLSSNHGFDYGYFAERNNQLAEWLRELKESRMVLDILGQFLVDIDLDLCCEDLTMTDDYCEKYCDNKKPLCWYRWAKLKVGEVNADDK